MIRLFRVFIPTSVVMLALSEIVLGFACFLFASYLVFFDELEIFLFYDDGFARISIVVLILLLSLYYQDMYTELHVRSKVVLLQTLAFTIGIVLIIGAALVYVLPDLLLPRNVMMVGCTLIIPVLLMWRIAYARGIFKALGVRRLLFLGMNKVATATADRIALVPQLGFINVGFVTNDGPSSENCAAARVLGPITDLPQIVQVSKPDCIVIGLTERRNNLPVSELLDLRFRGIHIQEAASLYETIFGRVPITELRPSQLIYTAELGPQPNSMRIQLIYSIAIAAVAFVVTLPILLLVAIAVRITSPGPILFRQKRVGLNGVPFTLFKFRSMVTNAEDGTGPVWAKRDDPRVTPIGKHLRMLRLDELPQLINVLRGEMSIVGPRPERPEFVNMLSQQIPFYRQRHAVRPGITGWAQVRYKYGDTIEDTMIKLEYDLYYIKNLSPAIDFYIMFQTLKVMLFTRSGQ